MPRVQHRPARLTREDCDAIGFEFHDERSAWNFLDGTARSTVRVDFSPDLRHAAVSVMGADWCGALLWSKIDLLGDIRGALVWDAVRHTLYIEGPEPTQAWTSPLVDVQAGALRIYANGEAFRQGRPDRVLP